MKTEKLIINAIEVFEIKSKSHWINSFPGAIPKLPVTEEYLFIDANGNMASCGEDFMIAEKESTYPIKIYLLKRIAHDSDPQYFNQLLNLFK